MGRMIAAQPTLTKAALVVLLNVLGSSTASATQYVYTVEPSSAFFGVRYENDGPYGGNGRSLFQVDFSALNIVIVADDATNTVTIAGSASGAYNQQRSDPSNLFDIPQKIPGTYEIRATYTNAAVSNPEASANPVLVSGAGSGDGYFEKTSGAPFYSSTDGRQHFWDRDFNGVPPQPLIQLSNYSFALAPLGNGLFQFDGWIHSGLVAGLEPFYHGDFHGIARLSGPVEVPEPASAGLLLAGLAVLRRRKSIA